LVVIASASEAISIRLGPPRREIAASPSGLLAMTNSGKLYFVYIVTNQRHTVLYIGLTSDLKARIYQHREKLFPGFTSRYNVYELVYYEAGRDIQGAILREKQLKAGSRRKKIDLIDKFNPEWCDLYDEL
jgi:putative endonuclease